jgi:hypothetical protein
MVIKTIKDGDPDSTLKHGVLTIKIMISPPEKKNIRKRVI